MDNLERLKRVVQEFAPDDTVLETDESFIVLNPNGLHMKTPDKSSDNVDWLIDMLSGTNPWEKRNQ